MSSCRQWTDLLIQLLAAALEGEEGIQRQDASGITRGSRKCYDCRRELAFEKLTFLRDPKGNEQEWADETFWKASSLHSAFKKHLKK